MADTENRVRPDEDSLRSEAQTGEFDKDVNLSVVVWTGVILTGITALSFLLMWWLYDGLRSYKEAQDPRPMPIQEAAGTIEPPGPQLQSTPEEDLRHMREQEEALMNSFSLLGGEEGYARIPVDEALDLVLELDLGESSEEGPASRAAPGDGMSTGEGAVEGQGVTTPADPVGESTPGSLRPSSESTRSR